MELLLSAIGISKSFQGRKVLDGINIEIKKSEIIAITGTSGVGKTTLLNILSTLDIPDDKSNSSLDIDGQNIFKLNKINNIKIYNSAVSDFSGKTEFTRILKNTTGNFISNNKKSYGPTKTIKVNVIDSKARCA